MIVKFPPGDLFLEPQVLALVSEQELRAAVAAHVAHRWRAAGVTTTHQTAGGKTFTVHTSPTPRRTVVRMVGESD